MQIKATMRSDARHLLLQRAAVWCKAAKHTFVKSPLSPLSSEKSGRTARIPALKDNVFMYISGPAQDKKSGTTEVF